MKFQSHYKMRVPLLMLAAALCLSLWPVSSAWADQLEVLKAQRDAAQRALEEAKQQSAATAEQMIKAGVLRSPTELARHNNASLSKAQERYNEANRRYNTARRAASTRTMAADTQRSRETGYQNQEIEDSMARSETAARNREINQSMERSANEKARRDADVQNQLSDKISKKSAYNKAQRDYDKALEDEKNNKTNDYLGKTFSKQGKGSFDQELTDKTGGEAAMFKLSKRCSAVAGAEFGAFESRHDMAAVCAEAAMNYHKSVANSCNEKGQNSTYSGWKAAGDAKSVKTDWEQRKGDCYKVTRDALQAIKESLAQAEKQELGSTSVDEVCSQYKDLYNGGKPDGEIEALCGHAKNKAAKATQAKSKARMEELSSAQK